MSSGEKTRRFRLLMPFLLLLPPLVGLRAGEGSGDEGCCCESPISGRAYRHREDPATGRKWIEDEDGGEFASLDAFLAEDARRVGEPWCRIDQALWPRLEDPERAAEPVVVGLILREQPANDLAGAMVPQLDRDLARLRRPAVQVESLFDLFLPPAEERARLPVPVQQELERSVLTGTEEALLRETNQAVLDRVQVYRRALLKTAEEHCAASQERVERRLGRGRVVARWTLLNTLWVELPAGEIPPLLARCPDIAQVAPMGRLFRMLDTSTGSVGASAFWNGGYTGSGIRVGVIDGGINTAHPALSAAVYQSKAFHAYAVANDWTYNDSTSNTSDPDGHGTFCAGVVASRNTTYPGVAKGVSILNADCFYVDIYGIEYAWDADCGDAVRWCVSTGQAISLSLGNLGVTSGSSSLGYLLDAAAYAGLTQTAKSAGNDGPSSSTISTPGEAFNILTVGSYDDKGTTTPTDDTLSSFSSRGPTSDGRRKPELAAPGASITSADYLWASGADYSTSSGTSFAAPHVAGGLALLLSANGSLKPEGLKALLLNNARNSSPFPSTPDNSWGWGGLNLSAAYSQRSGVLTGALTSSGARSLYWQRSSSLLAGDRVTLCWNRHVAYPTSGLPSSATSLLDLDLYLYDGTTGLQAAFSSSGVNPVEQVRATATVAQPVICVYRYGSFPGSFTTERIAVSAPPGFTAATECALEVELGGVVDYVGPGEEYEITAEVTNTGGLNAVSPEVELTLPSGYAVLSGSNPRTIPTLAGGASHTVAWTIRTASTSVTDYISVEAETYSYGLTITSPVDRELQELDAVSPRGVIRIDDGAHSTNVTSVDLDLSDSWDPDSVIQEMRFGTDGSTWTDWESFAETKAWTLTGGEGIKTVHLQVRDPSGHTNKKSASDSIIYDVTAPSGTVTAATGNGWHNASAVPLTLSVLDPGGDAASGWTAMRFRNSGDEWGAWVAADDSTTWTVPEGQGARSFDVELRDDAGNVSGTITVDVSIDLVDPTADAPIVDGGDGWRNSREVTLALSAADPGGGPASGVDVMRFRNEDGAWGPWTPYAPGADWTLSAGDGSKVVSAQFRDRAGNVVDAGSSSEDVRLDQTPPYGTILLDEGWPYTRDRFMDVRVAGGGDAYSGLADLRIGEDEADFAGAAWLPVGPGLEFELSEVEGERLARGQLRDQAGNTSGIQEIVVAFDATPPVPEFSVNGDPLYVLPGEDLFLLLEDDPTDGAPLRQYKLSWDGGGTWSDWRSANPGVEREIDRPAGDGLQTLTMVLADMAGNESAPTGRMLYLVSPDLQPIRSSAKISGRIEAARDCRGLAVDLVKGDLLNIKLKGKADQKLEFRLAIDVLDDRDTLLVEGRHPPGGKPGVASFPAPKTGRYTVILRRETDSPAETGAFSLAVKVKQSKANKALAVSTRNGYAVFEAVDGTLLKGQLYAPLLEASAVTLTGPDGAQALLTRGGPGKISFTGVLGQGTGAYELRIDTSTLATPDELVSGKLSLKLPK